MNRIVQPELLDTLPPDDPRAIRSRRDLQRINWWMGNHGIMADALREYWEDRSGGRQKAAMQITELGAGDGSFLLCVAERLGSFGDTSLGGSDRLKAELQTKDVNVTLREGPDRLKAELLTKDVIATLLDLQRNVSAETLAAFAAFGWRAEAVVADVFDWPQSSEEIVVANLFLHHFENERLSDLLRIISERAKLFIAIEPRRAPLPLVFSRLLCLIGCNDVTRHDATVSVRAGFAGKELSALWPDKQNWQLTERRTGLFSHLFIAKKID